jgi:hypothetical protein
LAGGYKRYVTTKVEAREALDLALEIAAARVHLTALEERFFLLVNGVASPAATLPPVSPAASTPTAPTTTLQTHDVADDDDDEGEGEGEGEGDDPSAASKVLAAFQRHEGKRCAVQDVVDELSDLDPKLVRSNAARFARQGKLRRVKRGVYKYISETEE